MHSRGSALLLTLLITATAGSILLTTTKTIINSTRIFSSTDSGSSAYQIAQVGINDGLLRLSTENLSTACGGYSCGVWDGEYGLGAAEASAFDLTPYSLSPLRRGFVVDSQCATWQMDTDSTLGIYDTACGYYDLTIRNSVAIPDMSSGAAIQNSLVIDGKDLPATVDTDLRIKKFSQASQITLLPQGAAITWKYLDAAGNPIAGQGGTIANGSSGVMLYNANVRYLRLTPAATLTSFTLTNPNPATQLAIEKGFTSIESTGYTGGVRRRLIGMAHRDGNFQIQETTQTFDANGFLQ